MLFLQGNGRKRGEAWAPNARAGQPIECTSQLEQPGQRCFLRSGRNPNEPERTAWKGYARAARQLVRGPDGPSIAYRKKLIELGVKDVL